MTKVKKLPTKLNDALEHYRDTYANKYWQDDQGTGSAVGRATANYEEAEADLLKLLLSQQNELRKLRSFKRQHDRARRGKICEPQT